MNIRRTNDNKIERTRTKTAKTPRKKHLLPLAIIFLSLALLHHLTAQPVAADHHEENGPRYKNVILFVTDDLSPDLGCYGNPVIKTPHLDALARQGTRFGRAFATTASCSASRSVILSGLHNHATWQYGHEHGVNHFRTKADLPTLPVLLSKAGYHTVRIGKFHVAPTETYRFDEIRGVHPRSTIEMAESLRAPLSREQDKPLFIYCATSDPHRGNGPAKEIATTPNRFGNPKPGESYPQVSEVSYRAEDVIVPAFLPDTPECRAELAQYYQAVSRVDAGIGRLMEIVKDTGHEDDTLVIFTSDHGIAMPGAKTTAYEPGLQVPMIVRHPQATKRGGKNDSLVSLVDLVPTILDYAGAYDAERDAKRYHGRSFLKATLGEEDPGPEEIYASHTFHEIQMYYPMRVVRTDRYKLIWNIAHQLPFPFASDLWSATTWQAQYKKGADAPYGKKTVGQYIQRPRFELFDLKLDPHETRNLADDPAHAKRIAELKQKLRTFQQRTGDRWVRKWEYE